MAKDAILENQRLIRAGRGEKHTKWEKVKGRPWTKISIQRNTVWRSVRFAREKVNYSKILMVIMFVQDVEGLDSLKKKRTLLKIEFISTSVSMHGGRVNHQVISG
jgi:hypothetical protein